MAARRTIDLGTVGFGLVPETRALEQSLTALRKYGKEVERLGQIEDETVQKQYRKFAQIERTLTTLYARTSATISRMKEAGVAASEIDKIDAAYRRVNKTLTTQADLLTKAQLTRASVGMGAIIAGGNRLASQKEASGLALAFRDLERAAILAIGPLSGVGARLAVLAALFDSVGGSMTLMIASATGVVTGIGLMAAAGVKASMDMERFNAQLTASTGAAVLNADTYAYLLELSNRLGQNVRDLIEPYAKFTTAARLSNVSLQDQRKIFEAATVAGTAMKLNSERMGLVFLALEQMFSKGTVSMEELRRQLGDLLPGSFAIAAQAMGVTESQLTKMIKNGEVLARDLLPKMAKGWLEAFGPAAAMAAVALQAQLQLLGSATFELLKKFDAVTGFSKLFREAVIATRVALEYLTKNMETVVALFGAVAGAGAGFLVYQLFARLPAVIMATVTAMKALTASVITLDLVMLATGWGALLSVIAKTAAVIIGAVVGYNLLKDAIDSVQTPMEDWVNESKAWLDVQEKIGKSHKQTTDEIRKGTQERLQLLTTELTSAHEMLRLTIASQKAKMDEMNVKPSFATPFGGAFLGTQPTGESPEVTAARKRLQVLEGLRKEMETTLERLSKLKPSSIPGGEESGTQWANWAEKISQSIREVIGLGRQLEASELGQGAIEQARGMAKAIEMMSDQPDKGRGNIEAISKSLRDAGFAGSNLTEQLAKLYLLIEQRKDTLKELEALPGKAATAGDALAKMFEVVEARRQAATTGEPTQLEKQLVTMEGYFEVLKKMGMTQEHINFLVAEFRKQWKTMGDAEEGVKEVEKLTKALERLDNQLGDNSVRVMEEYRDRVDLVWNAFGKGIITIDQVRQRLLLIEDDMNRKVIDRTTLLGRSMTEVFRDITNNIADTMAKATMGMEVSWRNMFDAITQEALSFIYKMSVVQPIMTALFGNLYSKQSGTGQGLLEDWLRSFMPTPVGVTPAAGAGYVGDQAEILGFAGGGSFKVGGSGGSDSQAIKFRASPGERVDILTPEQQRGASMPSVQVVINNQSGQPIEASQSAPRMEGDRLVVDLLVRRLARDVGARNQLRGLLAPAPEY